MKLRFFFFFALAFFCCACSGALSEDQATAAENLIEAEENPGPTEPPQDVTTPGSDNSEIVSSHHVEGSRTDTRTFTGHQYLTSIVVTTMPDGKRVGYAVGKDGARRELEGRHIAVAMNASADDLALMIGFRTTREVEITANEEPAARVESDPQPVPTRLEKPKDNPQSSTMMEGGPNVNPRALNEEAEKERIRRLQKELSGTP